MADKNKSEAGAATGKEAAPAPAAEPKKRDRLSFSREKKLAYAVVGLAGIFALDSIAKLLSEDQKAKVAKAKALADEVGGGDVLKPTIDRIAAIWKELKTVNPGKDPARAAIQAKELTLELNKQIARKAQIEEMIDD